MKTRYKIRKEQLERVVESFVMENKYKTVVKENENVDEAFGDFLRGYDKIFFRDNKKNIDDAKKLVDAGDEEKAKSIHREVLGVLNQFIKDKKIETGTATNLRNELRRKIFGGDSSNMRSSA